MASFFWEKIWHKQLGRPFLLAKTIEHGQGQTVILLHGIGRTGHVWEHVVTLLDKLRYKIVAFDLLGFGSSPKPEWPDYNVDDHAKAVIASILKHRLNDPVIIVGHSMGCLVAVRVARLRPDLVKHMVLFEMPLYDGLPQKKIYKARLNLYFKLYEKIAKYQPTFDKDTAKLAEKLAIRIAGFEVDRRTWQPFVKSLQNTIVKQTAMDDIKKLSMPIDVIYGAFDMLVIRGKPRQTFGSDNSLIAAHTVRARHTISMKASKFIVTRIEAAEHPDRNLASTFSKNKKEKKSVYGT